MDWLRMIRNAVVVIAFLPVMFVAGLIGGLRRIIKGP